MKKITSLLRLSFVWYVLVANTVFLLSVRAATVVVPNYLATNDFAFGSGTLNTSIREQEVYGATEFPSGTLVIKELRFRPDATYGNAFTTTVSHIQINLSTTSRNHDQLSANFADNVGANDTVVFDGPLTISSQFSGPASGPKAFDIIIPLTTHFSYDRSAGNLLLDIRNFSGSSASALSGAEAFGGGQDPASRVTGFDPNGASGIIDSGCDAIQVVYDSGPVTYDVGRDFSLASNPNGVWSYGAVPTIGGTFTVMPVKGTVSADNGVPIDYWQIAPSVEPTVYHNGTTSTAIVAGGQGVLPPEGVWFYPGQTANYGVIRFTVPSDGAGSYRIETAVQPGYDGSFQGDTDFHVAEGGVELFSQFLSPTARTGYTNVVSLAPGDTIDFIVGRGQDNSGVNSGLKIQATLTLTSPVPTSKIRLVSVSALPSGEARLPVQLLGQGNENGLSFSLNFDSTLLRFADVALGSGVPNGATLLLNTNPVASGKLGLALALPTGAKFPVGTQEVAVVKFSVAPVPNPVTTPVTFGDQPTARQLSDTLAHVLPAVFESG
ncbi:MAG TPA: hypothetical protein VFA77_16845, partial [Candidatus Eisenbacteria bacterium]|nr:hypothetical protein [Candidatus Eisenbacteria bacterium]